MSLSVPLLVVVAPSRHRHKLFLYLTSFLKSETRILFFFGIAIFFFISPGQLRCLVWFDPKLCVNFMENMNFEDFLIKPRNFWLKKSTTNLYSSLNGLPEIAKVLKQVKKLGALWKTCFGHLLTIPKEVTFSAGVMHNLMLRQICIPGVTREDEFHFLVGGKVAKFMKREFCLVIGLKFGVMSDIFLKTYHVISGGIHDRYFTEDENLQLKHVWENFMGGQFEQPKDGLKMASFWAMEACNSLVELVGNNLCHNHPRLKNWGIFKRPHNFFAKFAKYEQEVNEENHVVLEVLTPTDDEKIQPYLVGVDTNLSEGPQFVPLNYDDGEQRPNDDGNADGNDDDANDGGQSRPKQMKRKMSPQKEKKGGRTKRTCTSRVMSPVI
ncbi:hypothetical protein Ddye_005435 [Dipteronia dyeriana]|uniref:Uncharacterized protein n=1 Tax=Dipteronia dyeriana TaxID=168575 RepID=A0AAE0CPP6_9ROSI|nr:hypothetical protein Ddye_005435 [Dipteronia dyeriana]